MTMLKDIIYTNTEAFRRLGITIRDNLLTIILVMIGLFVFDQVTEIVSIGIAMAIGGTFTIMLVSLARYILMLIKFSIVASLLARIVEGETISTRSIFQGWKAYLSKLINYVFIMFLFSMLIDIIFNEGAISQDYVDHRIFFIKLIINIIALFIFNASFETLYQTNNNNLAIFTYGAKFFMNNFLQWLFSALLLMVAANYDILVGNIVLSYIVNYALMPMIFIYRGHLFKILDNSSVRMRAFRRRME